MKLGKRSMGELTIPLLLLCTMQQGFASISVFIYCLIYRSGHLDVVQYLVDHGADINAKDIENWTALHYW